MKASYWEKSLKPAANYSESRTLTADLTIIGSGIVGLSAALFFKRANPKARVVVLDSNSHPRGASVRNAGFACFGSISELNADLSTSTIDEAVELVRQRYGGLNLLRKTLGDKQIDYNELGGWEYFHSNTEVAEAHYHSLSSWNRALKSVFIADAFRIKEIDNPNFAKRAIFTPFEGQLNPGKLMRELLSQVRKEGVEIRPGFHVQQLQEDSNHVVVESIDKHITRARNVLLATNGFTAKLYEDLDLQPARNQVLLTGRINDLAISGNVHLHEGYIYFRSVGKRLLIGGGRHLDKLTETTDESGENPAIIDHLKGLLTQILQSDDYTIEHKWSGIMGIGSSKQPIVKALSKRLACAVRLGGMGVAIGMETGRRAANLF